MRDSGNNYSSFDEILNYLTSPEKNRYPLVLIDCTASDEVPKQYPEILKNNIDIVTPNKKGVSGSLKLFNEIHEAIQYRRARLFYEATVGAGLPVISALQDLHESGDSIHKIEGIFSGTLSYIFNEFGSGDAKFSKIVQQAKEKGYTEPDPRDDLNGMDVARKLTILGRTIGMEIEGPPSSSIFPIQSLIPPALESVQSGDEFVSSLPAYDADFDEKRIAAKREGKVLRYVGTINVATKAISVGVQTYFFSNDVYLIIDTLLVTLLPHYRDLIILSHFILKGMVIDRL
jgi:homoserine dehydrogenase